MIKCHLHPSHNHVTSDLFVFIPILWYQHNASVRDSLCSISEIEAVPFISSRDSDERIYQNKKKNEEV